jgi:hypothetical protein
MGDYIRAVRQAAASRGIAAVIFGHAGDGHVHVNLLPEVARPGWEEAIAGLLDEVTAALARLGGTRRESMATAGPRRPAHPDRRGDRGALPPARSCSTPRNPGAGRYPSVGEPPISRLKAGLGATPLPDDIAWGSGRSSERRYARCRLELADGTHHH